MSNSFWKFVVGFVVGISVGFVSAGSLFCERRENAIKQGVAKYNEKTGIFEFKTWPEKEENKN